MRPKLPVDLSGDREASPLRLIYDAMPTGHEQVLSDAKARPAKADEAIAAFVVFLDLEDGERLIPKRDVPCLPLDGIRALPFQSSNVSS